MPVNAYPYGSNPASPIGTTPPVATPNLNPAVGNQGQEQDLMGQMIDPNDPNRMERIREYIASLPPDQRAEQMKKLATDFGLQGLDAQEDMSRADALRQDAPQGREAGGMFIAANPLEHISQVMRNKQLEKDYASGREARGAARTGGTEQRQIPMHMLLRQ